MATPSPGLSAARRVALIVLLAAPFGAFCAVAAPATDVDVTLTDLERSGRLSGAVSVDSLTLESGPATLTLGPGVLHAASPVAGRVVELVYLGYGQLSMAPADDIEAAQLDLFVGTETIVESFSAAVLVVARDDAVDALLSRPQVVPDEVSEARAGALYTAWRDSPERSQLAVEPMLLADALGDAVAQSYFVAWLEGETLGRFVYRVDPDAREQVTLGRFERTELEKREARRLRRQLHKQQRRGRFLGARLDHLGTFDTWTSTTLRSPEGGEPRPGSAGFEAVHYTLEAEVGNKALAIEGRARIRMRAVHGGRRVAILSLPGDFVVAGVAGPDGSALPHLRAGDTLAVVLADAPAAGREVEIEIAYSGRLFDRAGASRAAYDTIDWYPHVGTIDRATYDVSLGWPASFDLIAGGERVTREEQGGRITERRRLAQPSAAFGFEIGRMQTLEAQAGHVRVTVSVDRESRKLLGRGERRRLLDTVVDALTFFEEIFGPYPRDELHVVTVFRPYSQSLPGLLTMSTLMVADPGEFGQIFGLEDGRTVIAHEVAHQWWGHRVGWVGYRDQWISEAMASYAATLWAAARLPADERPERGPTHGWQTLLTEETVDGRTIESIGPVVLGQRLSSSRAPTAYQAIVYKKGAVIFDMLADTVGEAAFVEALGTFSELARDKTVSTETFFDALGRIVGADLAPFTDRFVYGTGLPEIFYDYRFLRRADGGWVVEGEAWQESPYRFAYRVVAGADGRFDIARERLTQDETSAGLMVVPFQIGIFDPAKHAAGGRGRRKRSFLANTLVRGRVLLQGERTPFRFELGAEPRVFWLDRDQEAFARFYDQRRQPKHIGYLRGLERSAAGAFDQASVLFDQALVAELDPDEGNSRWVDARQAVRSRLLDALIHVARCRLFFDRGADADAGDALAAADRVVGRSAELRDVLGGDLAVLGARLALRAGDPERAYKRLARVRLADPEAQLLLAIAADATDRQEAFVRAAVYAVALGADLGPLAVRLPGATASRAE